METILVMLSGGVDSAFMLYRYLIETDLPVHAHHISMRYPLEPRWQQEDEATAKIIQNCTNKFRNFNYSESRFDFPFQKYAGWDSDLQLLVASRIAPNLEGDPITVALGWNADDLERASVKDRIERNVTANLWQALCASVYTKKNLNPVLAMPLLEMQLTKQMIIEKMPDDLFALCWSCRQPVLFKNTAVPCGKCHACVERKQAPLPKRIKLCFCGSGKKFKHCCGSF
jgi:7-cyano-7-deazaguanine synthase in queuosine biosynthesis